MSDDGSKHASPPGGRTLVDLLAELSAGQRSRRDALRVSQRVAQAVSEMHAQGRVHGALSPPVIEVPASGAITFAEPTGRASLLGRLRYASPEVARGDAAAPASDVFSLALLVRELIEGEPARRGTGDDVALDAVDGRVSVPHGLGGELQELALQSASVHGDQRPSAADWEVALRRAATQRLRVAPPWILLGLAAAAILVLALDRRSSVEAHGRTTRQYEEARDAFQSLMTGIYPELDRVEDVASLAAAGERALAALEGTDESTRSPADRELFARVLVWNGEAQRSAANPERARELFERASRQSRVIENEKLAAEIELKSETALGELAREARQLAVAREHFGRAVEVGEAQFDKGHADRTHRISYVRALVRYGDLSMSTGMRSARRALGVFARARAVLDDPEAGFEPRDREVLELRAELNKLEANMAFQSGETKRAIGLLNAHVAQAEQLIEMDPGRARRRWTLARGANVLARVQRDSGAFEDAVASLRKSVEAWRLLREMEPEEQSWRREWARTTRHLAEALGRIGEWQECASLHDLSLAELESMLAAGALPASSRLEIGAQLVDAAEGLVAVGDLQRARKRWERAKKRLGTSAPNARLERAWFSVTARASVVEAELLLAEGRWDAAETRAYRFIETVQEQARDGKDAPLRLDLARALLVGSAVHAINGRPQVARDARERALAVADELLKEKAHDPEALSVKARAHFVLGEDEKAAAVLDVLDAMGYHDFRLGAVRAATSTLRR